MQISYHKLHVPNIFLKIQKGVSIHAIANWQSIVQQKKRREYKKLVKPPMLHNQNNMVNS